MSDRGHGAGLAAILPRTGGRGRAARDPRRADRAEPAPAAPRLRRGGAGRAGRLDPRARGAPADRRAAARRAAATSWSRASGACAPRACAELETDPAIVRDTDDWERLDLALAENMAREDLNPVEEARACAMLVEDLGLTKEEVGRRVGRSRVAISNLVRLLELPERGARADRGAAHLSEGHGRAMLLCKDHAARRRLARGARDGRWSVRETERRGPRGRRAGRRGHATSRGSGPPRPRRRAGRGRGRPVRGARAARSRSSANGERAASRSSSTPRPRRSSWPSACSPRSARGTRPKPPPGVAGPSPAGMTAAGGTAARHRRACGRLAQSVRARL